MFTVFAVTVVFLILLLAEYLARFRGVHSELTRKIVHISVGVSVAFWPFFLSWRQIQVLGFLFLLVVLVSIKLNIFKSIHAVSRNVVGEVAFALVIGLLATVTTNQWIFAAAMLHLSLADGLAAVVGVAYGGNNSYKILGRNKSLAGTAAFFVTSVVIMFWYVAFSGASYNMVILGVLPLAATLAENVSSEGMDNLIMPLLVAAVLTFA